MKNQAVRSTAAPGPQRQGEIRSATIPHLFHELGVARSTGVLTLTDRGVRKVIQFGDGRVLWASSTDRDDRFSQVLLKAGVVSLKNLMRALEVALATKDRLGEVLVGRKMMAAPDVEKWLRIQVREIVLSAFHWTHGQFSFETKPVPNETVTLGDSADVFVIEGIRRITSWARAYEEVGGLNSEYRSTKDATAIVSALGLTPDEKTLLAMCDAPTSLEEMCEASKLSGYDVCKTVWALLVIGALMKS
jgi:hypothetical protein